MQVDPDGEAAWWVAAALGGAAFDAGIYIWQHRNGGFEWSGLGKSALRGAITGVAFGAAGKLVSKAVTAARAAKVARGMSKVAKVGEEIGNFGKLVKNPGIKWLGSREHALNRLAKNGISEAQVKNWIKNGKVIQQDGNTFMYVTKDGVAILNKDGILQTAYGKNQFKDPIKQLYGN